MANIETRPRVHLSQKDQERLKRPVKDTMQEVRANNDHGLDDPKQKVVDGRTIDIFNTKDNHLTFSVRRNDKNEAVKVTKLEGSHFVISGKAEEIIIAGSPDPVHNRGHIVELDGDMKSSHLGDVEVFDFKTHTPFTKEEENKPSQPRSRRMHMIDPLD